jgi:hypothetical protein
MTLFLVAVNVGGWSYAVYKFCQPTKTAAAVTA